MNVFTFSGHGITFEGDAIAVITELDAQENLVTRFINISGMARKFAQCKHTISIFILSMCRVELDDEYKKYVHNQTKN